MIVVERAHAFHPQDQVGLFGLLGRESNGAAAVRFDGGERARPGGDAFLRDHLRRARALPANTGRTVEVTGFEIKKSNDKISMPDFFSINSVLAS